MSGRWCEKRKSRKGKESLCKHDAEENVISYPLGIPEAVSFESEDQRIVRESREDVRMLLFSQTPVQEWIFMFTCDFHFERSSATDLFNGSQTLFLLLFALHPSSQQPLVHLSSSLVLSCSFLSWMHHVMWSQISWSSILIFFVLIQAWSRLLKTFPSSPVPHDTAVHTHSHTAWGYRKEKRKEGRENEKKREIENRLRPADPKEDGEK